jgi:hypothetical protein
MLLVHLIEILLWVLIIRHAIRWVSYHINHKNKKARVFRGNCRMPFDVAFALLYGINAKRKKRVKDLSYRKSLAEWMQLINANYPPDNDFTLQPHPNTNPNLITPKGDFSLKWFSNGNRKRKQFPELKTGNNKFSRIKKMHNVFTAKLCAKNNGVVSSLLANTKIAGINNLKNSQNPIPFTKQNFACTW